VREGAMLGNVGVDDLADLGIAARGVVVEELEIFRRGRDFALVHECECGLRKRVFAALQDGPQSAGARSFGIRAGRVTRNG